MRLDLPRLRSVLPELVSEQMGLSRYYAAKSDSLVIQADGSRKQSENKEQCFTKLIQEIDSLTRRVVKGETSDGQRSRVKSLYAPKTGYLNGSTNMHQKTRR